jgi:hypothetical protein
MFVAGGENKIQIAMLDMTGWLLTPESSKGTTTIPNANTKRNIFLAFATCG